MTLKLSQSDAFAAPGLHLASGIFDFDCGIPDESKLPVGSSNKKVIDPRQSRSKS
jgi:hypothetical protein